MNELYDMGGIKMNVMGCEVNVVIWIHIITGNTSGHNYLCGRMSGGKPT